MTTTTDWLTALPEQPSLARDQYLLQAVLTGLATCQWISVTASTNQHSAIFQVCDDALHVELDQGFRFRFPVSANLAQQCADVLTCSLLTAKVSDLAYQQAAVRLPAHTLPASKEMATINYSKKWNRTVELSRRGREGLLRDCGKTWILSNVPNAGAVNYGFYDPYAPYRNPQGLKMWQCLGTQHNAQHTDYSQILLLMKLECQLDGRPTTVHELMTNPKLCNLISYEGVLHKLRV